MTVKDIKKDTLQQWKERYPPPDYYDFDLTTTPHTFMLLDKFMSGRFHQFRVLKSCLTAHQSWHTDHLSTRCPRCYVEDEDLHHALLACPARSTARTKFISELVAVEDIWESLPTILKVVQYLRATMTGYPPAFSGWFPCSPSTSSDKLSEMDSISSSIFTLQVLNSQV
jgi:hypothetical protein